MGRLNIYMYTTYIYMCVGTYRRITEVTHDCRIDVLGKNQKHKKKRENRLACIETIHFRRSVLNLRFDPI